MSEMAISTPSPSRQALAAVDRSRPGKVTGKLRRALDLMAADGKTDSQAAVIVGMNVLSIRNALLRPHVRAYFKRQRDVLLESMSALDIHRLRTIADKAENMPAVNAIRMMHEMRTGESATRSMGSVALPGLTIQIITQSADVHAHTPQAPNVPQVIDSTEDDKR